MFVMAAGESREVAIDVCSGKETLRDYRIGEAKDKEKGPSRAGMDRPAFAPITRGPTVFVIEQRFFWEQTSIGFARFRLPITTWPYLKLKLGNLLLLACTLGFAWPWTTIRNIKFIVDQLALVGIDNFDEIVQAYDGAPPIGEGLDGFLDTGFDLG